MSISGNLSTMELSELLQWVAQGSRTGTLVLETQVVEKKIYFVDGKVVASASTLESEQLGHFLIANGYINEEELNKAVAMQGETGMLLGKILVTIGGISEDELLELLVTQTEESIYDIFQWPEADFHFVDGETLNRGLIPLALDVTAITLQGMNRLDEWSRIRKSIPSLEVVPIITGSLPKDSRSTAERYLLSAIDDQSTVRELLGKTHSSEFQLTKLLFDELNEGRLKLVMPRTVEVPVEPPSQGDPAAPSEDDQEHQATIARNDEALPPPDVDGLRLAEQGEALLSEGDYEGALRHFRAAKVLEPANSQVRQKTSAAEDKLREQLQSQGFDLDAVPVLERSLEQLTNLELSPEQGFLLTRIDGSQSIHSILKLSPVDRLEGELVFFKLIKEGHVRI